MLRTILLATAITAQLIDARVKEYVDAELFSGVVLVSNRDGIVYEKAFGLADRAFGVPNTLDTRFHIASVSKPITAAAILLLVERGKLALDDHVSKFVPDFPNGDRITVEELLTHYSGLADASGTNEYNDWSRFPQTPASLVEKLARLPMQSEPGTRYSYSNSNYHLLALIVEKTSGLPYGEFLERNIFKPLGMTNTAHHGNDQAIVAGLATGSWHTSPESTGPRVCLPADRPRSCCESAGRISSGRTTISQEPLSMSSHAMGPWSCATRGSPYR